MKAKPRHNARIHLGGRCALRVDRRHTVWPGFLFLAFLAVWVASTFAQTESTIPALKTIIARMAQARTENQARFRSYTVTRGYTLFGAEKEKSKSEVMADITFVPPDKKQFSIQQRTGSALGEVLVRRMLTGEADITKNSTSTDFSAENYDFGFVRQEDVDGQRCYLLDLLPKRKDRNLIRGKIWVDARTYLLRRTEGEPAKSPSWWLRDVRMMFSYGEVGGMWLQTSSEATAAVRFFGQHTMVMHDMKYRLGELVAAGSTPAFYLAIPSVIPLALRDSGSRK